MFTAVQRAGYIGASDMRYVMNEQAPDKLLKWWEVKVGLREPDPPNWAMKVGSILGEPIVDEYEAMIGEPITRRQEVVPSPVNDRLRSTLDGFNVSRNIVIEAKFAGCYIDRERLFQTYYAQVAMQMHCTNADSGLIVVGQGTNNPYEIECMRSSEYETVLLERAAAMLESMDSMTPPVEFTAPAIVPPEKWRTVDLSVEMPNWAAELTYELVTYQETKQYADAHEAAGKTAKALVPDDVGKVLAPEHIIARNKKGALVITRRNP